MPNVKESLPEKDYCISFEDVAEAARSIKQYVHYTPLMTCSTIDKLCGRNLFFKCENFQKTGSFKYRGAVNTVSSAIQKGEKLDCIITRSTGNHGQAIAKAAQIFGIPSYIIMPNNSPQCKKNAVRSYGGTVVECFPTEEGCVKATKNVCEEKQGFFVDGSQLAKVMAGQGTIAVEMLEQNPDLDIIVAAVGGGGMISGIALAAKHIKPSIKVYAAEPESANSCYLSKLNKHLTPMKYSSDTTADGARVCIGEKTWPIIRDLVDDAITVSEEEIAIAVNLISERAKLVIEPTTGVAVAAVLGKKFPLANSNNNDLKNVGVVLCGGNVDLKKF